MFRFIRFFKEDFMQIKTDENGNVTQVANMGVIPDGQELDLSDYRMDDNGNLILDTEKIRAKQNALRVEEIKARFGEIDALSNRPLRKILTTILTGEALTAIISEETEGIAEDRKRLNELETEAEELREELRGLI